MVCREKGAEVLLEACRGDCGEGVLKTELNHLQRIGRSPNGQAFKWKAQWEAQ